MYFYILYETISGLEEGRGRFREKTVYMTMANTNNSFSKKNMNNSVLTSLPIYMLFFLHDPIYMMFIFVILRGVLENWIIFTQDSFDKVMTRDESVSSCQMEYLVPEGPRRPRIHKTLKICQLLTTSTSIMEEWGLTLLG